MSEGDGENIWDISSWDKDINWKETVLRRYFDGLDLSDSIRKMVDLCNEYFEAVYTKYEEDEEGAEMQFSCLDIIVLMMEEYIYGPFYEYVSPIQELQIMEIFCTYFQDKPLDPIRYFVFDCLFGLPAENLEIQKGLMGHKMNMINKLTSLAVGTRCGNVLNCIAVWMHTYGRIDNQAVKLACTIMNDYCFICPQAKGALRDLIQVSPVFAYQFALSLAEHYHGSPTSDKSYSLPPPMLIDIIADWIIEKPQFCAMRIPSLFLELPSIHNYERPDVDKTAPFFLCPIFKLVRWCIQEPLLRSKDISKEYHTKEKYKDAYSKLLYGILNYISLQKKIEPPPPDDPDDLEPGELLEENEFVELLSKADVINFVQTYIAMSENASDQSEQLHHESVDRFVQVIQLCSWAGCLTVPPNQLSSFMALVPRTQLLNQVIARLSTLTTKATAPVQKLKKPS